MTTILFIWTIVGLSSGSSGSHSVYDWRPLGEFRIEAACHEAARNLNKTPGAYRCINKNGELK